MADSINRDIELGLTKFEWDDPAMPRKAVLTIHTGKHYNSSLASTASVYWVGDHSRSHMIDLGCEGDYSKLLHVGKDLKATQRNIDNQHTAVFTLAVIDQLVAEAKAHYPSATPAV